MATDAFVQSKIKDKVVVMFSKTYCPYCIKAENIFKKYFGSILPRDQFENVRIDQMQGGFSIQEYLLKLTGARTVSSHILRYFEILKVPRVFIRGKCIGGYNETAKKHVTGELASLISGK